MARSTFRTPRSSHRSRASGRASSPTRIDTAALSAEPSSSPFSISRFHPGSRLPIPVRVCPGSAHSPASASGKPPPRHRAPTSCPNSPKHSASASKACPAPRPPTAPGRPGRVGELSVLSSSRRAATPSAGAGGRVRQYTRANARKKPIDREIVPELWSRSELRRLQRSSAVAMVPNPRPRPRRHRRAAREAPPRWAGARSMRKVLTTTASDPGASCKIARSVFCSTRNLVADELCVPTVGVGEVARARVESDRGVRAWRCDNLLHR